MYLFVIHTSVYTRVCLGSSSAVAILMDDMVLPSAFLYINNFEFMGTFSHNFMNPGLKKFLWCLLENGIGNSFTLTIPRLL